MKKYLGYIDLKMIKDMVSTKEDVIDEVTESEVKDMWKCDEQIKLIPTDAPLTGHSDWTYELDKENNIITLNQFIGERVDNTIDIYSSYIVNNKRYYTAIKPYQFIENGNSHLIGQTPVQTYTNVRIYEKSNDETKYYGMPDNSSRLFAIPTLTNLGGLFNLDMSKVTDMSYLLYNTKLNVLYMPAYWNTGLVTTMESMFDGCTKLHYFVEGDTDLPNDDNAMTLKFSSNSLTNVKRMFYGLNSDNTKAIKLNINWGATGITDMSYMFANALLSQIICPVSQLNINMDHMFANNGQLTQIDIPSGGFINPSNTESMFEGCASLVTLDLTNFKTKKCTNMKNMFKNCTNLNTIYATSSRWIISDGCDTTDMFTGCGTDHVTVIVPELTEFGYQPDVASNTVEIMGFNKFLSSLNTDECITIEPMYTVSVWDQDTASDIKTDLFTKITDNTRPFLQGYADVGTYPDPIYQNVTLEIAPEVIFNEKTNYKHFFSNYACIEGIENVILNEAGEISMEEAFRGYRGTGLLDLTSWDSSKISNMKGMFMSTSGTIDISTWDITHITDASVFENMFSNSSATVKVSMNLVSHAADLGVSIFNPSLFRGTVEYA